MPNKRLHVIPQGVCVCGVCGVCVCLCLAVWVCALALVLVIKNCVVPPQAGATFGESSRVLSSDLS